MPLTVQLDQFEGPLDLLLTLIERQKLDITRVSLAKVADQYLAFLTEARDVPLDNLAAFLSVAARLILLKSKALLPVLEMTEEEDESIEDLEVRLREYQRLRDASLKLGKLAMEGRRMFARTSFIGLESVFYPPPGVTAITLRERFSSLLGEIPVTEVLEEKEMETVMTLEDRMEALQVSLRERAERAFSEIVSSAKDRVEIIVSFLALLELVKRRIVVAKQQSLFSDIAFGHAAVKPSEPTPIR